MRRRTFASLLLTTALLAGPAALPAQSAFAATTGTAHSATQDGDSTEHTKPTRETVAEKKPAAKAGADAAQAKAAEKRAAAKAGAEAAKAKAAEKKAAAKA